MEAHEQSVRSVASKQSKREASSPVTTVAISNRSRRFLESVSGLLPFGEIIRHSSSFVQPRVVDSSALPAILGGISAVFGRTRKAALMIAEAWRRHETCSS